MLDQDEETTARAGELPAAGAWVGWLDLATIDLEAVRERVTAAGVPLG